MNAILIGPDRNRVDGRLKVTGAAKYAVEFNVPQCVHACAIESNVAKATILGIDTSAADSAPGVLKVLTHQNSAPPAASPSPANTAPPEGRGTGRGMMRMPLADGEVHYAGQYVALVIAQT